MIREQKTKRRGSWESQYQSYRRSLFLIALNRTASSSFFFFFFLSLSRTLFSSFLSFSSFIFFHLALIGDVSQSWQAKSTGCGHKLQYRDKDGEEEKEREYRVEKALKISALQALSSTNPVTCPQQSDRIFLFIISFFGPPTLPQSPPPPRSLHGTQFPRITALISWKTTYNLTQ